MFVAGKPFYPAHVESPEGLQEDSEVVAILNEANLTEYKVSSKGARVMGLVGGWGTAVPQWGQGHLNKVYSSPVEN